MRLINIETLELPEFWDSEIPEYAILSHTWGDDEVTFQDWNNLSIAKRKRKKGYFKIDMACRQAQIHGLKYLWVDTNCIDKSSSSELSEAINSMFSWYQKASICYVYLADVKSMPDWWDSMTEDYVEKFCQSRWFTRGWTLQELIAPTAMTFYSQDWSKIASRSTMAKAISEKTQINAYYLQGNGRYKDASIAQKMSWVSRRSTKRIEDMAYCMLGIFDINMPLLYGEGRKSFTRLQEEIIRASNDQTIFCWTWIDLVPPEWCSLLAPCPQAFKYSKDFVSTISVIRGIKPTYKMTNAGLSISLPIVQAWYYYLGILNAKLEVRDPPADRLDYLVCVPIQGCLDRDAMLWRQGMRRLRFPPGPVPISTSLALCRSHMYVRSSPGHLDTTPLLPPSSPFGPQYYPILLVFGDTEKLLGGRIFPNAVKSKIAPGTQICLLERTRSWIEFEVFPPDAFVEGRSLITVDRNSLPCGFLIRIGKDSRFRRVLFIGIDLNYSRRQLYRVCSVVPESLLNEVSNDTELLQTLTSLMQERARYNTSPDVSWGHGIGITMREEDVTGVGSICLTYITCQETFVAQSKSDDGNDSRSDVAVRGRGRRENVPSLYGGLFEQHEYY